MFRFFGKGNELIVAVAREINVKSVEPVKQYNKVKYDLLKIEIKNRDSY